MTRISKHEIPCFYITWDTSRCLTMGRTASSSGLFYCYQRRCLKQMAKKKNKIRIPSAPESWNKRARIYIKGNKCSRNPLSASTMEQEWQCWEITCMSHCILAVLPIISIFSSNLRVHSKQLGIQHSDQRTTWRGHRLRSNSNCHQRSHTNSLKRCCWLLPQCWWETEAANSNGDSFNHVWTYKNLLSNTG